MSVIVNNLLCLLYLLYCSIQGEDEDVIQVDEHKAVKHITEHIVPRAWNTERALVSC